MIGTTRLWALTDLLANAGQLNLTKGELLQMDPKKAASILGRAAPLDLEGTVWQLAGVAITTVAMIPASRSWMIKFALPCASTHSACQISLAVADAVAHATGETLRKVR
jgi:hypothetical protein